MACPVVGHAQAVRLAPEPMSEKSTALSIPNSFDTAAESHDSIEKTGVFHEDLPEYGIDKSNFNHDFLSPDFEAKDMQKVAQEGIIIAGGAAAILLQVANPGVAYGVNRHSNFAYRVEDRLRTTMTFVYCVAYGTPEEKKAIINMVHKAHAPVKGDGYSADDADLQMWVAATLYATGVDLHEKVFGKFDEATAERIYDQYSVLASSLRVPPSMWPKTRADFWRYWDETLASFTVTPDALNIKKDMLYNKHLPLWVRLNMPALRIATAEWLPEHIRVAYGWKRHSRSRRAWYNIMYAMTRSTYPYLPKRVRVFPVNYYLKDMRKRLAAGEHII